MTRNEMLSRFERLCRSRGTPRTIQRRTVYETLLDCDTHPTVDEVYRRAAGRAPGISQATVYRSLEWLASVRLVTRVRHPGSAIRYEAALHRHDHLFCIECERVVDIDAAPIRVTPPADEHAQGFEIVDHSVMFEGLCPDCRKEKSGGTES